MVRLKFWSPNMTFRRFSLTVIFFSELLIDEEKQYMYYYTSEYLKNLCWSFHSFLY